jgi:hypothetical protein
LVWAAALVRPEVRGWVPVVVRRWVLVGGPVGERPEVLPGSLVLVLPEVRVLDLVREPVVVVRVWEQARERPVRARGPELVRVDAEVGGRARARGSR